MVRPTDREEMQYQRGVADASRANDSSGFVGVLLGVLVVLGLGAGAYYLFAGQSSKSSSPNIINVPAQQAPSVNIEAPKPDVNINVPSPNLSVPSPGGSTNGAGN